MALSAPRRAKFGQQRTAFTMRKNFTLPDSTTIEVAQVGYDVHNDFTLVEVVSNMTLASCQFHFRRTPEAAGRTKASGLSLKFSNVIHLSSSCGAAAEMPVGLQEVGYKSADDSDLDWLLGEHSSSPLDHLFVRLDGDSYFRIYAEMADVELIY